MKHLFLSTPMVTSLVLILLLSLTVTVTSRLLVLPLAFLGTNSSRQKGCSYISPLSHPSLVEKLLATPHWLPDTIGNHELGFRGCCAPALMPVTTHFPRPSVLLSHILHLAISGMILRPLPQPGQTFPFPPVLQRK